MKKLFNSEARQDSEIFQPESDLTMDMAIIGMSGRIGEAGDLDEFWRKLLNKENFKVSIPAARETDLLSYLSYLGMSSNNIELKEGAFLNEIDQFDHGFFNISHIEALSMAPEHRIFLEVAWHTLEGAGYAGEKIRGSKTGVYLGYAKENNQYLEMVQNAEPGLGGMTFTGNVASVIGGRLAHILDLRGPSMLINTACSSSLVAVHQACNAIRNGDCNMALVGSINVNLFPVGNRTNTDENLGVESANGLTRSFDDDCSGTGGGEGCVVIFIKPLENAIRDNDIIHAVIKGSAVNQDGTSINLAAPNVTSQEEVIVSAWKNAKIDPRTISYIEAHGTATPLGDPIEIAGLTAAFKRFTQKKQFCAISALKSNIGHLDAAAGIAGLVKAVLALKFKTLPPTINFDKPNRHISFENSPVYVNTRILPWKNRNGKPNRCGISAFGLSGTNAHVVLEEAPMIEIYQAQENQSRWRLFTLSAHGHEKLEKLVSGYLNLLQNENANFDNICYTASTGRGHFSCRLAIVSNGKKDLLEKLTLWLNRNAGNESNYIIEGEISLLKNNIDHDQYLRTLESEAKLWLTSQPDDLNSISALRKIAEWYVLGVKILWEYLYLKEKRQITSLPLYPFQKKRCWIEIKERQVPEKPAIPLTIPELNKIGNSPRSLTDKRQERKNSKEDIFQHFKEYFSNSFEISPSVITQETNVYEIGLDSISIMQLRRLIKKEYGLEIPVIELFKKYMKIGDLAQFISEKLTSAKDARVNPAAKETVGDDITKELKLIRDRLNILIKEDSQNDLPKASKPIIYYKPIVKNISNPVHAVAKSETQGSGADERLEKYLSQFSVAYQLKFRKSLEYTREHISHFANNRNVSGFKKVYKKFHYTIIADHVDGSHIWDLDGNEYIDFAMGFGVHFMGHRHPIIQRSLEIQMQKGVWLGPLSPLTGEVAKLITEIAGVERVAFYNSGTEAVMVAMRLARAATGKDKVVIFSGSYHGMFDGLLAMRNPYSDQYETSPLANGILQSMVNETYVLEYDDPAALEFIREHADEIGAVLVEPVQSRRPELQPYEFLKLLRGITTELGICLIFDEIITGFRILPGGAQEFFGIKADLVTYGKVAGGGLPLGIVAGKSEYLHGLDGGLWDLENNSLPLFDHRRTIVAGTFCHHPMAMASAKAMLMFIKKEGRQLYDRLNALTSEFVLEVNSFFESADVPIELHNFGSIFHFRSQIDLKLFFYKLIFKGFYVWEGATFFVSTVHTKADMDSFATAIRETISELKQAGLLPAKMNSEPRAEETVLPISEEQLRIWLKCQESPRSSSLFNELISIDFGGKINIEALQSALKALLQRHGSLRIVRINSKEQVISSHLTTLPIEVIEAEGASEDERYKSASAILRQQLSDSLFSSNRFIKAVLIKLGDERHLFGLIIHQIVADGYSLSIINAEIQELYNAYANSNEVNLPGPGDISEYFALSKTSSTTKNEISNFWAEDWKIPFPKLRVNNPFLVSNNNSQKWINTVMPERLYLDIKEFSKVNKVTPYVTLLSGYEIVVRYLLNESDVLIGIPSIGQLLLENPHTVGQCMQMLPFRCEIKNQSFIDIIDSVNQKFIRVQENRNYIIDDVIELADLKNEPCHMPIINMVFNMDPPIHNGQRPEIVEKINFETGTGMSAKYEMFVNVIEVNKQLHFSFQYNSDLFDDKYVMFWIESYFELLKWVLFQPDKLIGKFAFKLPVKSTLKSENISPNSELWEELSERLGFVKGTSIYLFIEKLQDKDVKLVYQMAGFKEWNVIPIPLLTDASVLPNNYTPSVVFGHRDTFKAMHEDLYGIGWNINAMVVVTDTPLSSSYLLKIPFVENEIALHVIFGFISNSSYLFHHSQLFQFSQVFQLLPIGKLLKPFKAVVLDENNGVTLPYIVGNLQVTDQNGEILDCHSRASYNNDGEFTIWSIDSEAIKFKGFDLSQRLIIESALNLEHFNSGKLCLKYDFRKGIETRLELICEPGRDVTADPSNYLKLIFPKALVPNEIVWPEKHAEFRKSIEVKDFQKIRTLIECVQNVLKINNVSIHDNFLELGGTSIQSIHLSSLIRKQLNITMSPGDLLKMTTLEEIFAIRNGKELPEIISPVSMKENFPLSHTQKRFWIVEQLESELHTSTLIETRRIKGVIDEKRYKEACFGVVERHESLRTVFSLSGGEPVQNIRPMDFESIDYRFEDWQNVEADTNDMIKSLSEKEILTPFKLETGPLIRMRLIRLTPEIHITILVTHHIIFDGWSFDVLMQDIILAYKNLIRGGKPFEQKMILQFKDYCVWINQLIRDQEDRLNSYWKNQFHSIPETLDFKHENVRPTVKQQEGGIRQFSLDGNCSRYLIAIAKSQKVSMFMVVQSSILALSYCYTSETDMCLGTPVADRQYPGMSQQIGCLINTLVVRTKFNPSDNYLDLLIKVRNQTLGAFEHQIYPFDLILSDIKYERNPSRNPLFDIGFTYHEQEYLEDMENVADLGITSEIIHREIHTVKTDFWFHFIMSNDSLGIAILYDIAIYGEQFMNLFYSSYKYVIETVALRPNISLEELKLRFNAFQKSSQKNMAKKSVLSSQQRLKEVRQRMKRPIAK